jgi:hypothetical protein
MEFSSPVVTTFFLITVNGIIWIADAPLGFAKLIGSSADGAFVSRQSLLMKRK